MLAPFTQSTEVSDVTRLAHKAPARRLAPGAPARHAGGPARPRCGGRCGACARDRRQPVDEPRQRESGAGLEHDQWPRREQDRGGDRLGARALVDGGPDEAAWPAPSPATELDVGSPRTRGFPCETDAVFRITDRQRAEVTAIVDTFAWVSTGLPSGSEHGVVEVIEEAVAINRGRRSALGGQSLGSWLPIHYPNPRELPVNPGEAHLRIRPETLRFAGLFPQESALHVLLAMQKVEGSNPFSRFRSRSTEPQPVPRRSVRHPRVWSSSTGHVLYPRGMELALVGRAGRRRGADESRRSARGRDPRRRRATAPARSSQGGRRVAPLCGAPEAHASAHTPLGDMDLVQRASQAGGRAANRGEGDRLRNNFTSRAFGPAIARLPPVGGCPRWRYRPRTGARGVGSPLYRACRSYRRRPAPART